MDDGGSGVEQTRTRDAFIPLAEGVLVYHSSDSCGGGEGAVEGGGREATAAGVVLDTVPIDGVPLGAGDTEGGSCDGRDPPADPPNDGARASSSGVVGMG